MCIHQSPSVAISLKGTPMIEEWVQALEFFEYSVSNVGRVRKDTTGKILTQFVNRQGVLYVSPYLDGVQRSRSVRRLVAECYLLPPSRPAFDTPINVDGDLTNNRAVNLMWRPRWFSIKYMKQFREESPRRDLKIVDTRTGEVMTCWEAALRYGLLYDEVWGRSVDQIPGRKSIFPTGHIFEPVE